MVGRPPTLLTKLPDAGPSELSVLGFGGANH
jgi:hypothetical protein